MGKQNCWEAKQCGRQPGGAKTHELGVCPAATKTTGDGVNGGKNAGRCCWVVAGTLCGGTVQGSFALKAGNCMQCAFYTAVRAEEGQGFLPASALLKKLDG